MDSIPVANKFPLPDSRTITARSVEQSSLGVGSQAPAMQSLCSTNSRSRQPVCRRRVPAESLSLPWRKGRPRALAGGSIGRLLSCHCTNLRDGFRRTRRVRNSRPQEYPRKLFIPVILEFADHRGIVPSASISRSDQSGIAWRHAAQRMLVRVIHSLVPMNFDRRIMHAKLPRSRCSRHSMDESNRFESSARVSNGAIAFARECVDPARGCSS